MPRSARIPAVQPEQKSPYNAYADQSLIPSMSLDEFVRRRTVVLKRIESAVQTLCEACALANAAQLGLPRIYIEGYSLYSTPITAPDALEATRKQVDSGGWSYLMSQSGLMTFMDAKAREDWRKQLDSDTLPPLTSENIRYAFARVYRTRAEMFERGLITIFERLSRDYRTNQPSRLGKRVILRRLFISYEGDFAHAFVNQSITNELDDLLRVFHVLDGKPEPDHRDGFYKLIDRAHTAQQVGWDGEYFRLRWYHKGSCHVTFKRADLVETINAILSKHHPSAF